MFHGFEQDAALKAHKGIGRKRWLRILFNIVLATGLLFIISLVVLSKIGGSGEPLRLSIEQFFNKNTRYEAQLETLNTMQFFPAVIVDLEGLSLSGKNQPGEAVITIGAARIETGFWDIALRSGKLRHLDMIDIALKEGFVIPKAVKLDFLKLADTDAAHAKLITQGRIGERTFSAETDLDVSGEGPGKRYRLSKDRKLEILTGDIKLAGALIFDKVHHARIENIRIMRNGKDILKGRLEIDFDGPPAFSGELAFAKHGSIVHPDLIVKDGQLSGTLASANFQAQDFARGGAFDGVLTEVANLLGYQDLLAKTDITLDIPGYRGKLPIRDGHIDIAGLPKGPP